MGGSMTGRSQPRGPAHLRAGVALAALLLVAPARAAAALPEIRLHPRNPVPACVTPERLMAFLRAGNAGLDPRHAGIATLYKRHGEAWKVRWDYAFFQMALETNFLTFRRGNGTPGDVSARQNNFAGLGATGGGVPGDSYPDVDTGVLAQIQHLVVYSGERIAEPVGARTRGKQDDIVLVSRKLARPVRFSDLTRRWAADRRYHVSIESIAERFRREHCPAAGDKMSAQATPRTGHAGAPAPALAEPPRRAVLRTIWRREDAPAAPAPGTGDPARVGTADEREALAQLTVDATIAPPAPAPAPAPTLAPDATGRLAGLSAIAGRLGAPDRPAVAVPQPVVCEVGAARLAGDKGVLVRAIEDGRVRLWALTVLAGFERQMAQTFIARHTRNGTVLATFDTAEDALEKANALCADDDARPAAARTASIAGGSAEGR